jgi:hypothetical protein
MAGTRWTWKQSVSETRVDTRVRKIREFPGLGKACLATEDYEGGCEKVRIEIGPGNETAQPLPSELERTDPTTLSEPPSPVMPLPLRPQHPTAVSTTSTPRVPSLGPRVSDQFSPIHGLAFGVGPPDPWSTARRKPPTRVR